MKVVIFAILLTFVSFCYASVDTRGLNDEQEAEIALQIAKMKKSSITDVQQKVLQASNTAAGITEKWAGVGKALATGIVATAKELGVAANEFAVTPLGKLATVLIVWSYIGKDLLHLLASCTLIFLGLPAIWSMFKWVVVIKVDYLEYKSWFFGIPRRKVIATHLESGDSFVGPLLICLLATIGICFAAIHIFP